MKAQSVFRGNPTQIILESAPSFFFFPPDSFNGEDLEQKLTISSNGRVRFTSLTVVQVPSEDTLIPTFPRFPYSYSHSSGRWMKTTLEKEFAEQFMNKIVEPFRDCLSNEWATDCGSWKLTVYNEENEKFVFKGCLFTYCFSGAEELSYYIRKTLDMPLLYAFDGGNGTKKYIYVSVEFEGNSRSYYYTTEDKTISVGDKVLVPFGKNELEGEVVDIDICSECDVPFPICKTRAIIKKLQKDSCE